MVSQRVLFQKQKLGKTMNALSLVHRAGQNNYARAWCHCMSPLHIESRLKSPANLVVAVRIEGDRAPTEPALETMEDREG